LILPDNLYYRGYKISTEGYRGDQKMAKKDKKTLPPSGAGLVRYFEEETKGPKLTPEQVVAMSIILAVFCLLLRFSG